MDNLHDLVAPYALDALDASERAAFEAHLDECESCRADLREMSSGVEALFDASAETAPAGLRARVRSEIDDLTQVTPLRSAWRTRVLVIAAPVAAAVAVVIALLSFGPGSGDTGLIEDILAANDRVEIAVDGVDAELVAAHDRAVLVARDLPALPEDRTYQVWMIGDDGPVSAGTFRPGEDGSATVLLVGTPQAGIIMGLTEEPLGGSELPTGEVIATAEV